MKELTVKTDKLDERNTFKVCVKEEYYEFLERELKGLANSATGVIETKALLQAIIQILLEKRQLEEKIDDLLAQCNIK
ncbi:MAG: hypothetical protein ACTTIC_07605 [Helicobacteraceae bacterium]